MNIELCHISKHHGEQELFTDVNLTFLEGQINCLMGASGSGKTTIMNMLMGFDKPDSGEIKGVENRRIAAVFQEDRLIEHLDAIKNVRLVCGRSVSKEELYKDFSKVGLSEDMKKPVRYYSGGMKRRVAIVRSMLAQSDLIILDEPFKGLDEELKKQVMDYVKQRVQGKTVIMVTHDLQEAQYLGANLLRLTSTN
jgi:NitT/TauT family transport system ATP-binding protein